MRRFICALVGHKWNHDWRTINLDTTSFLRVDCLRCEFVIDGAALKRISESYPSLTRDL